MCCLVGVLAKGGSGVGGPTGFTYSKPASTRTGSTRSRLSTASTATAAGGVYVYSASGHAYSTTAGYRGRPAREIGHGDGKQENIFYCKNGAQISAEYVCDFIDDCGDASDERSPSPCQGTCSKGEQNLLIASAVFFFLWGVFHLVDYCFNYDNSGDGHWVLSVFAVDIWIFAMFVSCVSMLGVCLTPDEEGAPGSGIGLTQETNYNIEGAPGSGIGLTQEINYNIVSNTFMGMSLFVGINLMFACRGDGIDWDTRGHKLNGLMVTVVLIAAIVYAALPSPFAATVSLTAKREMPCATCFTASGSESSSYTAAGCLKQPTKLVDDSGKFLKYGATSCAWRAESNQSTGWVQVRGERESWVLTGSPITPMHICPGAVFALGHPSFALTRVTLRI
jgi:hypothetical protein